MNNEGKLGREDTHGFTASELICEVGDNGQVERWNEALAELVDSCPGKETAASMQSGSVMLFDLVHPDDVANLAASLDLVDTIKGTVQTGFRLGSQDDAYVEMRWHRLNCGGGVGALVGIGSQQVERDFDEVDTAIESADGAMLSPHLGSITGAELAAFASAARHDLRAPLRAVHGFSEIILEDYAEVIDAKGIAYLVRIVNSAQTLARTIDGVADYLRLDGEYRDFRPVALESVVQDVVDLQKRESAAASGTVDVRSLPTVHGDPVQLRLLFEHLIANGLVHNTSKPPRVTVTQVDPDGNKKGFLAGTRVSIMVSDNGAGIASKDCEVIFTPFRRLASGNGTSGLGLGLAIAKRIVQKHGGELHCISGKDGGARFIFDLQGSRAS